MNLFTCGIFQTSVFKAFRKFPIFCYSHNFYENYVVGTSLRHIVTKINDTDEVKLWHCSVSPNGMPYCHVQFYVLYSVLTLKLRFLRAGHHSYIVSLQKTQSHWGFPLCYSSKYEGKAVGSDQNVSCSNPQTGWGNVWGPPFDGRTVTGTKKVSFCVITRHFQSSVFMGIWHRHCWTFEVLCRIALTLLWHFTSI